MNESSPQEDQDDIKNVKSKKKFNTSPPNRAESKNFEKESNEEDFDQSNSKYRNFKEERRKKKQKEEEEYEDPFKATKKLCNARRLSIALIIFRRAFDPITDFDNWLYKKQAEYDRIMEFYFFEFVDVCIATGDDIGLLVFEKKIDLLLRVHGVGERMIGVKDSLVNGCVARKDAFFKYWW